MSFRSPGRRFLAPLGAGLLACLLVFALLTALGVGGGDSSATDTQTAARNPRPSSAIQRYSEEAARRAGASGVGGARPAPELVPVSEAAFNAPIAAYRRYSEGQLKIMLGELDGLERALRNNRAGAARAAWRSAYARYLRLGAVYGEFGALDRAIDGSPGGLPGGEHDPHFTGLHRLELGLWRGSPSRALLAVAERLRENVRTLRRELPGVEISPLDYATRAHEILEDAQRDLLSGTDVPWSGEAVLATAAGLDATREVLRTLRPLLDGRENVIETVDSTLGRFGSTLDAIRAAHRGTWPTLNELAVGERERFDGALGAALEALSEVPGALETKLPPVVPVLPTHSGRVAG